MTPKHKQKALLTKPHLCGKLIKKHMRYNMSITQDLFSLSDSAYRDFHSHLMPTVDKQRVIGVRIPVLRKYAKSLYKENPDSVKSFLDTLPHYYYEENNLHAFLIECVKSYPDALRLPGFFCPALTTGQPAICFSLRSLLPINASFCHMLLSG